MNENYIDRHPLEKEAIQTILSIKDEFINNVPEDIFVKHYLPMLANKDGNTDLTEWLKVAGHVYAEVNIIDNNGNVIFKVPSIFKKFKTKEHKLAQHSVSEIIETSKLHAINSPIKGEMMMQEGLSKTLPDEELSLDDDVRWNNILKRYGYEINSEIKTDETSNIVEDKDTSFEEYDIA